MVATRSMTIQGFAALQLEGTWELVDGEPIALNPSGGGSSWIAGQIVYQLEAHVRAKNLGWIFPADPGFILFDDRAVVRSPDVAFVRRERLAELPESFVPMAPDLAVEVLSPTDRRPDALAKVAMYLQAGVQLVWLVDPAKGIVTVFRPDASIETLGDGDVLDGGDVLPGFSVAVETLFN